MKSTVLMLLMFCSGTLLGQLPNTLTPAEKIYGLSKFWQEVNYNFIFLDKVDRRQWEADYKHLVTEVQNTANDYEYYRLLQRFCASLNDGHTNVYFPKTIEEQLLSTSFGEYRLILNNIGGKAIVTRVNPGKKEEVPVGTEIVEVNGQPVADYIRDHVEPYIASSTDYIREDAAVTSLFRSPRGTAFEVVMKLPGGDIKKLTLVTEKAVEKEVFPPFEEKDLLDFRWLDNEVAYLSLNNFGDPRIDTLFEEKLPELYKAKALVVDLRYNGGGSTEIGRHILQYLTSDTLLYGAASFSRQHIPSYKAWGAWTTAADTSGNEWAHRSFLSFHDAYPYVFPYSLDTVRLQAERLVVPTALLIGHNTASAAEDFLIYADNQPHMVKIGEPTFGSTGQPFFFEMPGGGSARICTKKDTYPDGREFVGYGIQPDIIVAKTLEDYLQDKDPVLEQALTELKKRLKK